MKNSQPMIDGVNDSSAQAEKLAKLAKRVHAHINLIPQNPENRRNAADTCGEAAGGLQHHACACHHTDR